MLNRLPYRQSRVRLASLVAWLLLAAFLFPVAVAQGQEGVTDDDVNEVAKDLYCPVCENTPLDACPTQTCQDWRDEIRVQLAEGRSKEEIHQYFVERYGVEVLAEPPREGFNMLIWILPIAIVVIGALIFGRYLRGLRSDVPPSPRDDTFDVAQGGAQQPPPAADTDDYISRVEKEVREE
jgi:cytochrome c-type biogenesis protein CcmH